MNYQFCVSERCSGFIKNENCLVYITVVSFFLDRKAKDAKEKLDESNESLTCHRKVRKVTLVGWVQALVCTLID